MNVILQKLRYQDLKDRIKLTAKDSYGMISQYLTPVVCDTLLNNPNLNDFRKPAINIIICDEVIVGRNMLMPTKLKINNEIFFTQTVGSVEIVKQFRGQGLGTLAFEDGIMNSGCDSYIGQLYSTTAAAIVQKLGLIFFELPLYYKLCKSSAFLESKGLNGFPLKLGTILADFFLKFFNVPSTFKLRKLKKIYRVEREITVPDWVNDITLNDGHTFMEVHDHNWLQWCLDNKFTEEPNDKQSFFSVYDKQGKPKGFFMTKERLEKKQGKYKNITRGTIVEWGSYNEEELSEIDLNLLAVDSFGENIDNITTILSNTNNNKMMKKIGFLKHGTYQMFLKPGEFNNNEIADKSKWRIRYGGCNTIIL